MNNTIFKKLEGALVELSLFKESDITQEYISWLNNSKVVEFSNQRFIVHNFFSCKSYLASFKEGDNFFILIKTKHSNKPIGTMTAYCSIHHGVVDIGILIGDINEWGKGYGQDAWDTLFNWIKGIESFRKITAGTASSNFGMLKIIKKSGMTLEATKRKHEIINNREVDILYFCKFIK
jgi:[ribosomal protein S5]-alanine N-acetyltransferase